MSGQAKGETLVRSGVEFSEDPAHIGVYLLKLRRFGLFPGDQPHPARFGEGGIVVADRFAQQSLNSIPLVRFAIAPGDEYPVAALRRRAPEQGKKVPGQALAIGEKLVDVDPAFQAEPPGQSISFDQLLPSGACGPWRDGGPALCGRFWSPYAPGSHDH